MPIRSFILLLLATALAGCAVRSPNAFDGISQAFPNATSQLAQDAAYRLDAIYPAAQTTFAVDTRPEFGAALEGHLRRLGFGVDPVHGILLRYQVDLITNEYPITGYVRLDTPQGSVSQMYRLENGMVIPAGSLIKTGLPDFSPPLQMAVQDPAPEYLTASTEPHVEDLSYASPHTVDGETGRVEDLPVSPSSDLPTPTPDQAAPAQVAAPLPASTWEPVANEPGIPAFTPASLGWTISPGMLQPQLQAWADLAGYQLIWRAENDYEMFSTTIFNDDFIGAVKALFGRMHLHGNPLRATIYRENQVLEVQGD